MKNIIAELLSLAALAAAASPASNKNSFAGVVAKRTNLPIVGVNAEITIPHISPPPACSAKEPFGGQILLGLDTTNCSTSTTVGIQFFSRKGQVQYRLFYQWLAGKPVFVKDVAIKAGDDLRIGIEGDEYVLTGNPYNGTVYFTNYSNGQNTTINTIRKVPACANNAVILVEQLDNYKLAKFSKIQMSGAYYVLNYGTFLHGNAVSEESQSYNLTDSNGKKVVATTINGPYLNFTYVA